MPQPPAVAVLGLGAMGHAFAANLQRAGFPLRVWNRTRSRGDDLADNGAIVAATPREATAGADIVIAMLSDGDATRATLLGTDGALAGLRQGGALVQMATIGVQATQALLDAVRAERADIVVIDAPVSGSRVPAEQGQVRILASGARDGVPGIDAVFDAIGKDTLWLGEAGNGSRMKLAVNAWLATLTQGLAESARLAGHLGLDIDAFWSALDGGPLASPYAKLKLATMKQGTFEPQFALALGAKDVRLALQAMGGNELPTLACIDEAWSAAVRDGDGDRDIAVVYRHVGGQDRDSARGSD